MIKKNLHIYIAHFSIHLFIHLIVSIGWKVRQIYNIQSVIEAFIITGILFFFWSGLLTLSYTYRYLNQPEKKTHHYNQNHLKTPYSD